MAELTFRSRREIDVAASTAWRWISHYDRDVQWRGGLTEMTPDRPGPVVDGMRVDEELVVLRKHVRSVVEVHDVVPGESFRWRTVEGADAEGMRSIRAVGARRCEVTLVKTVRLHGLERLAAPVVRAAIRRTEREDTERFERLLTAHDLGAPED